MILPTIRQIQIIADAINLIDPSESPEIDDAQLSEPWRGFCLWIQNRIETAGEIDPEQLLWQFWENHRDFAISGIENFQECYDQIRRAMDSPLIYQHADDILLDIDDLQWLWKGWLLRGLPSLLAAVPGTGKSYLALDIARRVIEGGQYPDGQSIEDFGPVLFVDAENTPVIHKQRISVWPERVRKQLYIMLPEDERFVINLDDYTDRDRLFDMAWKIRPILIIVDSYGSCTLRGENNKEDVQILLAYFNQLAREFQCGVLVVHHLRKASGGQTSFLPMDLDSIRGSSHIAAMARHIWGLQPVPSGPDRDNGDPRRLWVMKSNVGAPPSPLGVTFHPHPSNPEVAHLTYGAAPQAYKEPTKVDECADWILAHIMDIGEPVRPADLVKDSETVGYYRSLIYRARKTLGDLIIETESPRHPKNAWGLAEWQEND